MAPPIKEKNVDEIEQHPLPRQVGFKLLEISTDVLSEQLGREPQPTEFADMAETMSANLLSAGYLELRAQQGPEVAEKWLKKALAQVSAAIRSSGSDAFPKIDLIIKDVPNRIIKRPQETKPAPAEPAVAPAPAVPVCACTRTDGQCQSCQTALAGKIQEVYGIIQTLNRFKESADLCPVCSLTEFDQALARSVPVFWKLGESVEGDAKTQFAQELLGILTMTAALKGLKEVPLTLKAWKEFVEAKGVQVE